MEEKNTLRTAEENAFLNARERARSHQFSFQLTGEYRGAVYINDAALVTLEQMQASLESIPGKVILITGREKASPPYEKLKDLMKEKVKAVIYLGSEQESILRSVSAKQILFVTAVTFDEALHYASRHSLPGDTVLYSPGCVGEADHIRYRELGFEFKRAFEKMSNNEK